MNWIREGTRQLARLPRWVSVPLLIVEGVVLGLLFLWLFLTRSVGTVEVPGVRGRMLDEVKPLLRERQLRYRVNWESSLQTPEGEILRQIPRAGSRIKENRALELYVSKGPEYVVVPDVTGKTLLAARNYLRRKTSGEDGKAGSLLTLGNIARVYLPNRPQGEIHLQNPSAGERVIRGSRIDVLVSKGSWPRRTVVPDLSGLKLDRARNVLQKNHLEAGNVNYVLREDSPPSVVLQQTPPPRRLVPRGKTVSLRVNLSSQNRKQNPLRYTIVRITPPLGLEPGHMKVRMNDYRGTRVVYDREVKPGERVQFMVSVKGAAELVIYWNDELYQFRQLEVPS